MPIRSIALMLLALPTFAAGPFFFIQASDPQFGMYSENRDFRQESANWEFVIASANRLRPSFLIVTGDLTNQVGDANQMAEYKRINRQLDPAIHLYNIPGNHDVGNEPTPETLSAYRKNYGSDYYSFREGLVYGIVLDSSLFKAPGKVSGQAAKQEIWLNRSLHRPKPPTPCLSCSSIFPGFSRKRMSPTNTSISR